MAWKTMQYPVMGALIGVLSYSWSLVDAELSCCSLPTPPRLVDLGPPPKPRWISLQLECNGSGFAEAVHGTTGSVIVTSSNSLHAGDGDGDYRDDLTDDDSDHHDFSSLGMQYTTAVLDLAASQNDGSGHKMSTTGILLLLAGLLLVTAIIVVGMTLWYKKKYLLKYKVSPEESNKDETKHTAHHTNGVTSRGHLSGVLQRDPNLRTYHTMDKQTLVGSVETSHASLSSASGDIPLMRGQEERFGTVAHVKERKDLVDRTSVSSGIGMSQPDLQDPALMDDAPEHCTLDINPGVMFHRPYSGGRSGLPQVEYSMSQPDIVKSTLHDTRPDKVTPRGRLLPILEPLQSSREPKKSRTHGAVDSTEPDTGSRALRRSSSRQRPLSVCHSGTPKENIFHDAGDQSQDTSHRAKRGKKKNVSKKKHKDLLKLSEGDTSEVFANPYAKLPGIDYSGQQESCA